ncbi:MAG: EamA family transporter, partial [Clostridia bacterium]|nr:EamA family transporter [Clostridia bacterium]
VFQLALPSALGFLGAAVFERERFASADLRASILWLLYVGVMSSAITYLIQAFAQSHLKATTISVLSCTEPVFAAVFSIWLGYDSLSLRLTLGFMLIISATLIICLVPVRKKT